MKLMKMIPLVLCIALLAFSPAIAQEANSDEVITGTFSYNGTQADTIPPSITRTSYSVDLWKAMTIKEDPNTGLAVPTGQSVPTRSTTAYKAPIRISIHQSATEMGVNADSLIMYNYLEFSMDSTDWAVATVLALDSLNSTTADTNATVIEWELLTNSSFPDFRYMRMKNALQAVEDSASTVNKYVLQY